MPRFAANLSTLFRDHDYPQAMATARALGFRAVEILFPYDAPPGELASALARNRLELVLINSPAGDWAAGERGLAALPGREAEFAAGFARALGLATALAVPRIHVMAGVVPAGAEPATCAATFVANLRVAAARAADANIALVLEALNADDVPGYLYGTATAARAFVDRIDRPNVGLQFDLYHELRALGAAMSTDAVASSLAAHLDVIRHVQFSGVPGRHEPQHGRIDLQPLFARLDELGYDGWVGCEYVPLGDVAAGLAWAAPWGLGTARPG